MPRIKAILFFLSFILITGLAACGGSGNQQPDGQPAASVLNAITTNHFVTILQHYYDLKNALVRTNSTDADKAAAAMQADISTIRSAVDTTWAQYDSLQQNLDSMAYNLDKILKAKDESCEVKRIYFKPVSDALYVSFKRIQLKHVRIYHTFCPMAFREKGAFWLSDEPEIKNPYFGAKMIECGEVIDTLQ